MSTKPYFKIDRLSCNGFTLVELLVVIALIATLASLLVPILAKAKQKALGLQCLNNQRQLALAWRMYTEDNNGVLLFSMCSYRASPAARATWVLGQLDYDPYNRSNWDLDTDIRKSPLWPYCNENAAIRRCPADTSSVKYGAIVYPRVRSFAMNFWLGGNAGSPPTPFVRPRDGQVNLRFEDLANPGPSQTFLFLDVREDIANSGSFLVDMTGYPDAPERVMFNQDVPASYHNRAAGISFADGHSEIKRWLDPRTMPPLKRGEFASIVERSPNNPDIIWLQQRATALK